MWQFDSVYRRCKICWFFNKTFIAICLICFLSIFQCFEESCFDCIGDCYIGEYVVQGNMWRHDDEGVLSCFHKVNNSCNIFVKYQAFTSRQMKWNESGFRPPFVLSWARRTSWGWWDGWDDTAPALRPDSSWWTLVSKWFRIPALVYFCSRFVIAPISW